MKLLALVLASVAFLQGECQSGYLFISSPAEQAIEYAPLQSAAEQSREEPMFLKRLTLDGMVKHPLGLAVDNARQLLYVADKGQNAILSFRIYEDSRKAGTLNIDRPVVVMNVTAHWVAVNGVGTLFASEPQANKIWTLPAEHLRHLPQYDTYGGFSGDNSSSQAAELYTQQIVNTVRRPEGVATDGQSVFWANGEEGEAVGTVVRGSDDLQDSTAADAVKTLNKQTDSAFGVCLTSSRLYYTSLSNTVFTVRTDGSGRRVAVTDRLQQPRGCAYDGDGTIFVADQKLGKVFSFAGGAPMLAGARVLTPVVEVPDAYGLAVLTVNSAMRQAAAGILVCATAILSFLTVN